LEAFKMQILLEVALVIAGYFLGAIPFGLIVVWLRTGRDVRQIESGRTGGTNVMRATGFWYGFLTALLDVLKAATAVWLAQFVHARLGTPASIGVWTEVFAPLAAILGHNYSIFLARRDDNGRLKLGGGAGGAPSVGGAFGLWPWTFVFIFPIGLLIFFGVGYASVTTMSAALIATVIFAVGAWLGYFPWHYVLYGVLAEALLVWALRPNIKRLIEGRERLHGWRAKGRLQPVEEDEEELLD
jgi:acyl phosphate:glycerol-3-phosphate acyltransferase